MKEGAWEQSLQQGMTTMVVMTCDNGTVMSHGDASDRGLTEVRGRWAGRYQHQQRCKALALRDVVA